MRMANYAARVAELLRQWAYELEEVGAQATQNETGTVRTCMDAKRRVGQYVVKAGRAYYRLSLGTTRPHFALALPAGEAAAARCQHTEAMVRELRRHNTSTDLIAQIVQRATEAPTFDELERVRALTREMCASAEVPAPGLSSAMRFGDLFSRWHTNELHALFPDHVRKLKPSTQADYASLYRTYVEALLGHLPVGGITLDHAFEVMQGVPAGAASNSLRRNTGIIIARPLKVAIFPLRILESSPIPKGFLPKKKPGRAKVYLYPEEDHRLLGCSAIDLAVRLFYGMLVREGLRVSELARLELSDIDLKNGVLVLDKNKTDEPRQWAMTPGTVMALRRYVSAWHPSPTPEAALFQSMPLARATGFRDNLRRAGIDRAQLFEHDDVRRHIVLHDLRASFVTIALAEGKSEAQITDRTGHRSSAMLYRYKRAARTHQELGLGPLTPLCDAIPELGSDAWTGARILSLHEATAAPRASSGRDLAATESSLQLDISHGFAAPSPANDVAT
jgi:integrase